MVSGNKELAFAGVPDGEDPVTKKSINSGLAPLLVGVKDKAFYQAIPGFRGTARRLQLIRKTSDSRVYIDFAHSPSKVSATVSAVKMQFPDKTLISVLELHTYSSLNLNFISEYAGSLNSADQAVVYYNSDVIQHKGLEEITKDDIKYHFGGCVDNFWVG